jgi:hypothetical protein
MHIVISWDIHAEGDRWKELNDELKECLSGYSWVKPLTTLYIVQVAARGDRIAIKDALVEICRENPKLINVVVSPAMQGGTYSGWLSKSLWPKIQKRTE